VGGGGLHRPWDPVPEESYHHLGLSPMRPNELWTCPDDGSARAHTPGCQRRSCGSVWRGRGGDRCSQRRSSGGGWGSGYPRSPVLRNDPGTVTIPQYRFNKNKATHPFSLFRLGSRLPTQEMKKQPRLRGSRPSGLGSGGETRCLWARMSKELKKKNPYGLWLIASGTRRLRD